MHFYLLIAVTICLHRILGADMHPASSLFESGSGVSAAAVCHAALACASIMLESILPTIALLMPERAPVIAGLIGGCNALAIRIAYAITKVTVQS